ncbi:MAG: hypothetical protein RSD49_17185 [Hafnia sp.]
MMAEKAKCSDDPTMTRLDYLALELMTAVIENNYSLPEVSYDGYENWESMIAAQCYSMAKSTENALNTSTPTA